MERAAALMTRYDAAWGAIADRNSALCSRADRVEASVRTASGLSSASMAGFQHLQAEIQLLPNCLAQLRELTAQAVAVGGQLEALEEKLDQITVAQVRRAEVQWRQQEMDRAAAAQAQRRQELQQLRERMELQTSRRLERQQEERRHIFHEQFEAERALLGAHGSISDLRLLARASFSSVSLADVDPAVGAEALDDFYATE